MLKVFAIAIDSGYHPGAAADASALFSYATGLPLQAECYLLRLAHSQSPLPETDIPYTLLNIDCGADFPAQRLGECLDKVLPDTPALWLFGPGNSCQQIAQFFAAARSLPAASYAASLKWEGELVVLTRLSYAGNLTAELELACPAVVSFAKGCLAQSKCSGLPVSPKTQSLDPIVVSSSPEVHFVSQENPLLQARRIIAAGRGVTSKHDLDRLAQLAAALHAELGVSRPLATNGWQPFSRQLGISGETVSPEQCLLLGISGSSAFLYGIRGAQHVMAVNPDSSAPVFSRAEQGSTATWEDVCSALERLLKMETPDEISS